MNVDDLFNSSPELLVTGLEKYQQNLVNALLSSTSGDYERAADLWLSATPAQTAGFGGDNSHFKLYREKVIDELEKFVCGTDDSYQVDRERINEKADATREYIIGVLSAGIGSHLGVSGAFIAPIIVLVIMSLGKISVHAWCELRKEKRTVIPQ